MHTIVPIEELFALVGISGYVTVGQETVDDLAEVTGDRQWIHCDPDRAADSPFGGTIAHGHLTLALAPALLDQVLPLDGYAWPSTTASTSSGSPPRFPPASVCACASRSTRWTRSRAGARSR